MSASVSHPDFGATKPPVETNPFVGAYAYLLFPGEPGSPGPWKLNRYGHGLAGYVHQETGNFVEVSRVDMAVR